MSQYTSEPFVWPVRVYYEDSDAQGLVYFANYFKFMERARTEWLRARGIEQDELLRDGRRFFVVTETSAEFLQPARFNDQLAVTAMILDCARASFLLEQEIFRGDPGGELLCRGTARAAFVNAETMKPARLPDTFFEDRK